MSSTDKSKQSEASTSAANAVQDANKGEEDAKQTLPQLGALEEDDEFEEFEAEDWDDSETTMAQLNTSIKGKSESLNAAQPGGAAAGANKTGTSGIDSLWEDNWDDDDIEDDFSVQLRKAITESNGPQAMQTS